MGQIGTRVSDEFEEEFVLEGLAKGKNKSDYLKDIIDARHTIDFLKNNDGLLLIIDKETLARFEYFASLQSLDVDIWVRNLLTEMHFDTNGKPCTDTSIFANTEIASQDTGVQVFANVNTGVNEPVNSRKQQILQNSSQFVYNDFSKVLQDFYYKPREDLHSLEFLQTIFDFLTDIKPSETELSLKVMTILLVNLRNVIKYFEEFKGEKMTESQVQQLNYMLYEEIGTNEVYKVESFFGFLNNMQ